jgi:hypothetical protein
VAALELAAGGQITVLPADSFAVLRRSDRAVPPHPWISKKNGAPPGACMKQKPDTSFGARSAGHRR